MSIPPRPAPPPPRSRRIRNRQILINHILDKYGLSEDIFEDDVKVQSLIREMELDDLLKNDKKE